MKLNLTRRIFMLFACFCLMQKPMMAQQHSSHDLEGVVRLQFQNPGLPVDLGVGLWPYPLPMDYDGDGDMDLVVCSAGFPYNGLYFFENTSGDKFPVFKAPVRIGERVKDVHISFVNNEPRVLGPGIEYLNFRNKQLSDPVGIFPAKEIFAFSKRMRSSQWRYVDFDNDGDEDLIVGLDDWSDYGWDNAYDNSGRWTRGPLHGYVFFIENVNGEYRLKGKLEAAGKAIDMYGPPSPNMCDFDGDGDLDLICGDFTDKFTWFENIGTREKPEFAQGRLLVNENGLIHINVEMEVPNAVDWDSDGDMDLVVGDEDGRVALIENTGKVKDHMPVFKSPVYFQQEAADLKFGALVTPVSVDWDDDGDEDLLCGNTAGQIAFIENFDGGNPPKWNRPVLLETDGKPIRFMAGKNGSIQGPAEEKWGYTTFSVADWDGDGLKDIVANSIWGKVEWFKNIGTKTHPKLAAMQPVKVDWEGKTPPKPVWNWWNPGKDELVTQWRTTPLVIDWNKDGLADLVMLDQEGYLAFYERFRKNGELLLHPGKRIFEEEDSSGKTKLLRLNAREAGHSGRRKLCLVDWDNDGDKDLLANSENAQWYENVGEKNGKVIFRNRGNLMKMKLTGHSTCPTTVDWNHDGVPELLVGAEDGHFYYQPHSK